LKIFEIISSHHLELWSLEAERERRFKRAEEMKNQGILFHIIDDKKIYNIFSFALHLVNICIFIEAMQFVVNPTNINLCWSSRIARFYIFPHLIFFC
jgi:hypothetical protein